MSCSPPTATCCDAIGPDWIKLGLAVMPEQAELCQAWLGGMWWGPGLPGTRCPPMWHVCVHPECGVFPACSISPAHPMGPLGTSLAPALSLEGVMCQHRARDKDSDYICMW